MWCQKVNMDSGNFYIYKLFATCVHAPAPRSLDSQPSLILGVTPAGKSLPVQRTVLLGEAQPSVKSSTQTTQLATVNS